MSLACQHQQRRRERQMALIRRYFQIWLSDFRIAYDLSALPTGSVARAIKNIDRVGGFTYNPRTNQLPSKGVAVAVTGHSAVYLVDVWRHSYEQSMSTYLNQVGDMLAANGRLELGGWYDRVNKTVFLDLVEVFADRASAIAAGKQRNELAVFDLATQTEIRLVPGTATRSTRPPLMQIFVRNSHRRPKVLSTCCWEPQPLQQDAPPAAAAAQSRLPESIAVEQALAVLPRPLAKRVSSAFSCDFPRPRKPVDH